MSPSPPPCSRFLLLLGLFTLAGCALPRPPTPLDQARLAFAQDAFCPLGRVSAQRRIAMPPAPAAIATDPERMAMWRAAAERRALAETRQTVTVSGCGERVAFDCWPLVGVEPAARRGARLVYVGAACSEASADLTTGQAAP